MNRFVAIDIGQLRIGMHVHLETGWLRHPFPVNSFKVVTQEQLNAIQTLGLSAVQVDLSKSDATDLESGAKLESAEVPCLGVDAWRKNILTTQSRYLGAISIFDDI